MKILINIFLAGVLLLSFRALPVNGTTVSQAFTETVLNDRMSERADDSEEEEESEEEESEEEKEKEDDKPKPRGMMGNKAIWDPGKQMFVPQED